MIAWIGRQGKEGEEGRAGKVCQERKAGVGQAMINRCR